MILINFLLQTGTNLLTNNSTHFSITVIAGNLTGRLVTESVVWLQVFPIITLIIGSLLTFFLNSLFIRMQEKREIYRYEYSLITDILDIAREECAKDNMVKYYFEEKRKPIFIKIKNYKPIIGFMKDVIDEKPTKYEELEIIRKNLENKI